MQGKIFKKISLRLVIILAITAVAAMLAVNFLNNKTKQLEKEISEIMAADIALPVLPENPVPSDYEENAFSQEDSSYEHSRMETENVSDTEKYDESRDYTETSEETESYPINQEDSSEESEQPQDSTDEAYPEPSTCDEEDDSSEITEQMSESSSVSDDTTIQTSSEVVTVISTSTVPASTSPTTTVTATTVPPTTTVPVTTAPTTTAVPETEPPTTAPMADPVPMDATEDKTYVTEYQLSLFKNRLIQNINDLRGSMGLCALREDACLSSGAIIRSQEIVTKWSHERPNGDRGMYVIEGCGGYYEDAVNSIRNGTNQTYALGENLAVSYSYSDYSGTDEEILAIADEVFTNWVNSSTHYANLVYEGYTKIGLGVTVTLDEGIYHAFWVGSIYCNK